MAYGEKSPSCDSLSHDYTLHLQLPESIKHLRGVEWVPGLFLFPLVLGKM